MNILIEHYPVSVFLGCWPGEQDSSQDVFISLNLSLKNKSFAQDDLSETVDYSAVLACVDRALAQKKFRLLEYMAWLLGQEILSEFDLIEQLQIEIEKTRFPMDLNRGAGMKISYRTQRQ